MNIFHLLLTILTLIVLPIMSWFIKREFQRADECRKKMREDIEELKEQMHTLSTLGTKLETVVHYLEKELDQK